MLLWAFAISWQSWMSVHFKYHREITLVISETYYWSSSACLRRSSAWSSALRTSSLSDWDIFSVFLSSDTWAPSISACCSLTFYTKRFNNITINIQVHWGLKGPLAMNCYVHFMFLNFYISIWVCHFLVWFELLTLCTDLKTQKSILKHLYIL